MRTGEWRGQWPLTYVLMAVNVGVFFLHGIFGFYSRIPVDLYFGLSLEGLSRGYLWQLLSFQFLHAGLWHLLFNLIGLYFLGRAVEECAGRRGFLFLYIGCGTAGGILQVILAGLERAVRGLPAYDPGYFGGIVVGASAGVYGLLAVYATLFPDRIIALIFPPITFRARTLFWVATALAAFGVLVPDGGLADGAHLGGILAGWALVRFGLQGQGLRFQWPSSPSSRGRPRILVRTASGGPGSWQPPEAPPGDDLPAEEFIRREVDPILDKISARGIHSLTARERQILEQARARMSRE